ncbi:MAG: hypothetical protein RL398_3495 [Planctomycetota bacterium]|jgi:hypothetical protein
MRGHRIARAALLAAVAALSATAQESATHWAFVPPRKSEPTADSARCTDDIDRHVLGELRRRGLDFAAPADPATLLRRAHLVLTGLPPTPDDVAAFSADPTPSAFAARVDALLADVASAEHLATDWLDLARFADTYGYQADFEARVWPWRDWLIESLHQDKPWPRFVEELLAGDLLPDADVSTRTATAFWRLHRQTNEGGSIEEEWRHEYIADRVDTFGATFLGLTVGCARCHDHKSDPIRQRDYYSLGSFFAIDENGLYPYSTGVTAKPTVRLTDEAQRRQLDELTAAERRAHDAYREALAAALAIARPGEITPPPPLAHFSFDAIVDGKCTDTQKPERTATIPAEVRAVEGSVGAALECDGDGRIAIPDLPAVSRDDAFSVRLRIRIPDHKDRAVVLHTSHYTQDADTQGYQLLLEDGRLTWTLAHHWPGAAVAVRTTEPAPLGRWIDVVATYDGSGRAAGLGLYFDGEATATTVVRDHLTGPSTVRRLELGGRDRDRGFAGGRIDEFAWYDRALTAAEVATLAGREPDGAARIEHHARCEAPVAAAHSAWQTARKALHAAEERVPELMVMAPHGYAPQRFVLRRGAYDQPDPALPVVADVPAAILPWRDEWPRDRLGLARWLLDPANPLPARVVVDRLWALCFGHGLVPTPDNFGVLGTPPVHSALLDSLAADFAEHGSMRAILRRIVLSTTFAQSSIADASARERDPHNELLARGPSFRLSAEVLRDQALAASDLLHRRVGGPSSKPFQPPGLWRDAGVGWGGADYKPDQGPDAHRRSLYTYRKRTAPPPNLLALDGTSRESCSVRRQTTDTPLQALVFWNDPVFVECAEALATRTIELRPESDRDARLRLVFAALAGREPRPAELRALSELVTDATDEARALALAAMTLLASDAVVVLR